MRPQRPSDGHHSGSNVPQQQIVGFHVEGQSPSPSPNSILQDSLRTISTGSPTPVIIPPQFQRETSLPRSDSTASRSLAPEFSASTAGKPQQTVLRTTSGDRKPDLAASQGTGGAALPPPAPAAAAQAGATQQQQTQAQQQQQQAQAPGDAATGQQAAATGGSSGAAAAAGSSAGSGTQAAAGQSASEQAQQQQQQQQQQKQKQPQQQLGTPSEPDAPAPGQKPPPKVPKPTSKAERRALQEAQRAAKAAAKEGTPAAAGGGGGASSGGSGAGGSSAGKGGAAGADGAAAAAAAAAGRPPRVPASAGRTAAGDGAAAGSAGSLSRGGSGAIPSGGSTPAASSATGRAGRAAAGGAASVLHSTELFAHLQQYRPVSVEAVLRGSRDSSSVHPAVLALGLRYGDGSITGSTARCVALVHALCQVIADYHTPPGKSLQRDLMGTINAAVDFLVRCRPLSVSMGNAIKALKLYISKTDPAAPEAEAKASLLALMREWLQEKVAMADKVLVGHAVTKVYDGDAILTYAYSQVVLEVLLSAAAAGRRFHVVVLDSRPELEGRQMLRRLLQADIPCSYVLLSGLSYIMREVSKVMLGASAVLSNGTVLSRAGSAAVAMTAHASSKPVLVCCEAFKFHERVQLDSITHNELGDPDVLAHVPAYAPGAAAGPIDAVKGAPSKDLKAWRDSPRLALLNLKYDAMPAEFVTMVVTEFGMIPPSSVPVILREFSQSAQLE